MKVLDRKLLREVYRSSGLLLAIAGIVAVGVMCFVAMQSSYQNLTRARTQYYRQCRMADFWIDLKKVPAVELDSVRRIPGIQQLNSRIQFAATVDLEGVTQPLNSLVLSLPDQNEATLNDILLRQGDYFTNRRANEVIVNDAFARAHAIYPGQSIHLLLNNRRQELFVVGTAISSEFTYLLGPGALIPDPEHFGVFYLKRRFAEEVFDFDGAANQLFGRLSPGAEDDVDAILERAERLLEPFGVASTTRLDQQISNQFLNNEIDGLGVMAWLIPSIFLAVAALVLNVLITRLARQQRTIIGTLKALGYSDLQVSLHFLKFGIVVGVVGGLTGSLLGYLAATGMTIIYRNYFEFPSLPSGLYWYTHGIGMTASVLCSVAGSLNGTRTMLRLDPAESMRPEPPRKGGSIWLEQVHWFWTQLGWSWRMALRSVVRGRLRTSAGVFAAMMGAGLLTTGFMMIEVQTYLIDFQFFQVVRSDMDLSFESERGLDALDEVRRMPGVDRAEPLLNVGCTFSNGRFHRKAAITGLIRDSQLTIPRRADGQRLTLPEHGLIISRRLAQILHLQPGDSVTVTPVNGQRRPVQTLVRSINDGYLGLSAYAEIRELSRMIGEEYALNGAQLSVDRNPVHRDDLFRQLKQTPGVQAVTTREDLIGKLMETLLESQYISIFTITLFSGVIFFGSIVNASLVTLSERQREVATLRATGYTSWQVGGMFLRESVLVNSLGTLLGLPCGYGLMQAVSYAYSENDLIRMPVVTAPWIWLWTLLAAGAFVLIAHGVVQWRIHALDLLDGLKVRE